LEKKIFAEYLCKVSQAHGLQLAENELHALSVHYELLVQWQKAFNLVSKQQTHLQLISQYLDCLLGLQNQKPPTEFADIGTGAGFPGFMAVFKWPNSNAYLIEIERKKCSFLQMVSNELALKNLSILRQKAPMLQKWQLVLSRAAFSLSSLSVLAECVQSQGRLLLWLGKEERLSQLSSWKQVYGMREIGVQSYTIPEYGPRVVVEFLKE